MSVTRAEFETAIEAYWGAKGAQLEISRIKAAVGAGTAGSVRGGKHFDPIALLLAKFFLDAGYPTESIRIEAGHGLELPGYFRPSKRWDLVVAHKGTLVAAFELKALGGPSFGNNYNNRMEEALGTATDARHAIMADLFPGEVPWLGFFLIVEDDFRSRRPVSLATKGAFPMDPAWVGLSYMERSALSCDRFVREKLYDAVCCIASSPDEPIPVEFDQRHNWLRFQSAIEARITYLSKLGLP
ncbi:Type II restriction enzyme PaeR7I [Alloactinosynnema sp. L-07]|uniref:PaeR7I family type II restriction endonuclease n=1 Tax=Alloactinosynnema sp. L-07 TaxID=1653480 RepID=UPI00065EFD14|nr:PaeR7I family type II restriction endonuclease [Alloactinosynnema sp. L-07]CRK61314.1 Type II restriction enzyme PaeR7I [Alloactinosynnema sp. L-07]